jgi:uncharacterized protein with PQ loop repeat
MQWITIAITWKLKRYFLLLSSCNSLMHWDILQKTVGSICFYKRCAVMVNHNHLLCTQLSLILPTDILASWFLSKCHSVAPLPYSWHFSFKIFLSYCFTQRLYELRILVYTYLPSMVGGCTAIIPGMVVAWGKLKYAYSDRNLSQ